MTALSGFLVTAALVGGTGTLVKLRPLRRERTSLIVPHMVAAMAGLTAGLTLSVPPVYMGLDRLFGVPNLFYWGYHAVALYGMYHLLAQAILFGRHKKLVTHAALARITVILALPVLLGLALTSGTPEIPLTLTKFRPTVATFQVVWASYLLFTFTYQAWTPFRWLPHTRPEIARGLAVIAAGAAVADVYGLANVAAPAVRLLGFPGFVVLQQIEPALLVLATGLLVLGVVLPSLEVTVHSYRCLIDYRALRPLWSHLYRAQPEIVLHSSSSPWRLPLLADMDFRLYRRVIEIHDGILPLRPYLSPSDEGAVRQRAIEAGLTGSELDTIVTAALLRTALARQQAGGPCLAEPPSLNCVTTPPGDEVDLQSEVTWLRRVTRAFISHPLVPPLAGAIIASTEGDPA